GGCVAPYHYGHVSVRVTPRREAETMPEQHDRFLKRLADWQARWLRIWVAWAAIYAAGFLILWLVGPAASWPWYAWGIGWALVKGFWDRRDAARATRGLRKGRD